MVRRFFDLHSAEDLIVTSNDPLPCFKLIKTQEKVKMKEDEIGLVVLPSTLGRQGIVFSGGWIKPRWTGTIAIELGIFRECVIRKGDPVAHVIVLELKGASESGLKVIG